VRRTAALAVVAAAGLIGCGNRKQAPPAPKAAAEPPKITQLYAPEAKIGRGEPGKICFGVEHTKAVRLSPGNQELAPSLARCVEVEPAATTTYTLTAEGADGQHVSQDVTIAVGAAKVKIVQVNVSSVNVSPGDPVVICYTVANAQTVTIEPGGYRGGASPKGCKTVQPVRATTYVVTAIGPGGDRDEEKGSVKVK